MELLIMHYMTKHVFVFRGLFKNPLTGLLY